MKQLYDKLFDAAIALFILVTILCAGTLIVTAVVLTIRTGDSHSGIIASSAIATALALITGFFYLTLQKGGTDEKS